MAAVNEVATDRFPARHSAVDDVVPIPGNTSKLRGQVQSGPGIADDVIPQDKRTAIRYDAISAVRHAQVVPRDSIPQLYAIAAIHYGGVVRGNTSSYHDSRFAILACRAIRDCPCSDADPKAPILQSLDAFHKTGIEVDSVKTHSTDRSVEFLDSGWNVKHIHRLIVMSETYRQSSTVSEEVAQCDPSNALLARQLRLGLPAELIWDQALAVSGLIHHDVGGPSFRPNMPAGATGFGAGWDPSSGKERFKRGIYTQFQRNKPHPFLMNFDSPEFLATVCRRQRSLSSTTRRSPRPAARWLCGC